MGIESLVAAQWVATRRRTTLITAVLVAFGLIGRPTIATVVAWFKVGNTLAVMLGFVLLSVFSADWWQAAGTLPWQQVAILLAVLLLATGTVMYRKACGVIDETREHPVETVGASWPAQDPVIAKLIADSVTSVPAAVVPGRVMRNLRLLTALLLVRRVIISGVLVAVAVLLLGVIVIGQQESLNLMHVTSTAQLGFSFGGGAGGCQLFLSEALLKVALLLGVIAAGYFVFANPSTDADKDLLVPSFVTKTLVLWSCYQSLRAGCTGDEAAAQGSREDAVQPQLTSA